MFKKQKQTPSQVPLRDREERPFLYNRPHSPGREIDIIDNHAPFYHQSINPAQYDYEYNTEPANFREPANFDNLVNHSGSTLDDSNLKEGESVLDGSDSYSGSDKSRDVYQRNKVQTPQNTFLGLKLDGRKSTKKFGISEIKGNQGLPVSNFPLKIKIKFALRKIGSD